MKPTDISRQAECEYLDQILKSNMSETKRPNRIPEKEVGRKKRSVYITGEGEWGRNVGLGKTF